MISYEYIKSPNEYSTELYPFVSNINLTDRSKNNSKEFPEIQKYFSRKTNNSTHQYMKPPNAINANTVLVFGDSFSLISVNYFTQFNTVYFIRSNRLGDNKFDLNQFLLDHPEIDDIIIQLSTGETQYSYHKELQELVDNLQE